MTALRALAIVALACGLATADTSARAKADATAAYQEGQRRYLDEDYVGAAKQFEIAYDKDPDPAYLFNIAQAYRLAKQCVRSAEYYRSFLDKAAKPPNADVVRGYIKEMDDCARTEAAKSAPPAKPVVAPPPPTPPPAIADTPADHDKLWQRSRLALFGVGGLGLVVGAINTYYVQHVEGLREKAACTVDCDQWNDTSARAANDLDKRGRRDQAYMIAGYAVGAAAIAGGVVMTLLRRGKREAPLAIAPARGGAVVQLRF